MSISIVRMQSKLESLREIPLLRHIRPVDLMKQRIDEVRIVDEDLFTVFLFEIFHEFV